MRLIPLLLGAAAVAAAARVAITRSRSGAGELPPTPPTPTPPPPKPAPSPVASVPPRDEAPTPPPAPARDETREEAPAPPPAPPRDETRDESPAAPTTGDGPASPAPSAVSPATETVRAKAGQIDPADVTLPDDREVEREVEAQLSASPVAKEADVTVEVRDRIASLEGTVPDPETAQLIADETAHVDGVQGLDNRLRPEREAAAGADADDARDPAGGETERD